MTLLEVLVAMVIVAIGVLTVLQSQASSHRLLAHAQSHERLAILAEGVMEKVIAQKKFASAGKLSGRLTGALSGPNDDVSWTAQFHRPRWSDTTVMVQIELIITSRDGMLTLNTERYSP